MMGRFKLFRRNKIELSDEQKRWNKMWDMWVDGCAESPYTELMTYQSEINNGGHSQYFSNTENELDLIKEMAALETVLPEILKNNLRDAYNAYLISEENDEGEEADKIFEQCDDVFFKNEEEIKGILEEYAERIAL